MGKLGKKARKFSKKNLQSVERRNRKLKPTFKKRGPRKNEQDSGKELKKKDAVELTNGRNTEVDYIDDFPLDQIFHEDDSDAFGDESDSDGYLSEEISETDIADSEAVKSLEILDGSGGALSIQNEEIHIELVKTTKKLKKLKEKDPEFAYFLESYHKEREHLRNKDYVDEDGMSDEDMQPDNVDDVYFNWGKLTSSSVDSLCQLVTEQQNVSALTRLLNGYRAACHYGAESTGVFNAYSDHKIQNSEILSKILMFMLKEADNTIRGMMGLATSNSKKEKSVDLKKNTKWSTFKPLIKSYLRSTLFLLNQVDDSEILAFSLERIRVSTNFFVAFPSLLRRLIKISVHLWATGRGTVSSLSFLIIRDVASLFRSDYFDTCFVKAYKSFLGHCQFVEPTLFQHIEFLRTSFIDLCSIDVQKASSKALVCIQKLSKIMQQGLRSKKKEAVKKICSWQYTSCIDLWVMFISANIQDYDLQQSLFMLIQIINGVAVLFSGPRYLPLRIKCIQWLNHLSTSSGIFIPLVSFMLDILEYKISKDAAKPGKAFNHLSSVKLPKHWLKSRNFQEQCVLSAIELLSAHFSQWSHHISFPDLATVPLICLKKFHDITTIESSKRVVKRFIDQVEQNIEFVRKKRDEAAFSPTDQQSAELFLQFEKQNGSTPFTQYYKSIINKAASRNFTLNQKLSEAKEIKKKIQRKIQVTQDNSLTEGILAKSKHPEKRRGIVDVKAGRERKLKKKETIEVPDKLFTGEVPMPSVLKVGYLIWSSAAREVVSAKLQDMEKLEVANLKGDTDGVFLYVNH